MYGKATLDSDGVVKWAEKTWDNKEEGDADDRISQQGKACFSREADEGDDDEEFGDDYEPHKAQLKSKRKRKNTEITHLQPSESTHVCKDFRNIFGYLSNNPKRSPFFSFIREPWSLKVLNFFKVCLN